MAGRERRKSSTPIDGGDAAGGTSLRNEGLTRRDVMGLFAGLGLAAITLGAGLPLATLPGCGNGGGPKESDVLTSGYIPILDCVPLIVAYDKGYFKELGIRAEKPALIRSWPALLEAFGAKKIKLTHILLPQVIFMRYAQKVPIRSVAFNHTNVVAMLRAKSVKSNKDLGGKIVGCPTWWAPHTGIYQDVIRALGLKPVAGKSKGDLAPDEVGFRVIPPPDMIEGLKQGTIAGCTVSEPFGAGAEVLAGATLMKMSGDVWPNHPCCQSVMLEETINRDRRWSQAVTSAIYRAAGWARENREELATILGKDGGGYFPMPVKVVRKALMGQDLGTYGPDGTGAIMHPEWDVKRVEFQPYPQRKAFTTTIDMMRRMVVPQSAELPPELANLSGDQIAQDIVDYELANRGFEAAGGPQAFGLSGPAALDADQVYDVKINRD